MATVNYSVPEKVKQTFNQTFAGRNKSAIIAELMMRAVEEEREAAVRARAMDELMRLRDETSPVDATLIRAARDELRACP
jgi:hypothetical protein